MIPSAERLTSRMPSATHECNMTNPPPFKGVIKLDVRDSKTDWTPYMLPGASKGAPNVLVVLYDDSGLAAMARD